MPREKSVGSHLVPSENAESHSREDSGARHGPFVFKGVLCGPETTRQGHRESRLALRTQSPEHVYVCRGGGGWLLDYTN